LNTKRFKITTIKLVSYDFNMEGRPSWDEYFLEIAHLTSKRSNCIRRKVGCIIVKDTRILSLGYNGTPRGTLNCFEGGCDRCMSLHNSSHNNHINTGSQLDLCMCLHAEENALLFVGQNELMGATMYVTLIPCVSCTKKILQCGLKRVVYSDSYNKEIEQMSLKMLQKSKIEIKQMCLKN
jgi:dCMP deaminase